MTTLGSSVQPLGNLLPGHDLHDHLRAVPPAIAPHADPLNFCSPRIAGRGAIELDGTVTRVVYVLFMRRKLTITIDDALYQGLYRKVGPRKIARFIEEIVRPHVVDADLDSVYQEMAHDEAREREAEEWSEALLDDVAPGSTSRNEPR